MIEYYTDKNLNKKLHSQGLHIIQSPVESYVKPAGKSRKITRSITDTDEYFITTYFVLPTIIIMIITGIIVPIPWEDTILSWGNIMWVCLLALIAPLLYMLIVTPLIVVLDLAGRSLKITPKPQKKYAIKTKKQQLLNNYSKPLQLISKYNKNGMLIINDLVKQTAALFAGVVGQEEVVAALRAAAVNPVHAYLFRGPSGNGGLAAAYGFAAALLCPEGGATLAAYHQALNTGLVDEDDRVVLFNCATGLKYPMPEAPQALDRTQAIDFDAL